MKWTWTDENMTALEQLWRDDVLTSEIARTLGKGVTRNMVIGKAHRMGLPGRDTATFVRISQVRRLGKRAA